MRLVYDSKRTLKVQLVIQPGTVFEHLPGDIAAQLQGQGSGWRVEDAVVEGWMSPDEVRKRLAEGVPAAYSPEAGEHHASRGMAAPPGTAADGAQEDAGEADKADKDADAEAADAGEDQGERKPPAKRRGAGKKEN